MGNYLKPFLAIVALIAGCSLLFSSGWTWDQDPQTGLIAAAFIAAGLIYFWRSIVRLLVSLFAINEIRKAPWPQGLPEAPKVEPAPTGAVYCNRCGGVNTSGDPNCKQCQHALAWWKA